MEIIKVSITGTRPLLMHADIFSDPLNAMTKAHKVLTSKRTKSDEDHELIAQSEWRGGIYFDDTLGPYLPGINIEAAMVAGGKLSKLGTQLKRSVEVIDERCALEYEGPRTLEKLWNAKYYDMRGVGVSGKRITRCRPLFREWATTFEIMFDQETIDRAQVIKCLSDGGLYCGVGDFRPKFGRFSVEVLS